MKRRTLLQATAASATLMAAPMIKAQTLPTGPIRIVVGFPPGGGTDALARVLAQKLQAMWNITIVIDNKAGAAGVIAADFVAKQPADGNTLLMHTSTAMPWRSVCNPSWATTWNVISRPLVWSESHPTYLFAMNRSLLKM